MARVPRHHRDPDPVRWLGAGPRAGPDRAARRGAGDGVRDRNRRHRGNYKNAVALIGRRLSPRQHERLLAAIGRHAPLLLFMEEGGGLADILVRLAKAFAVRLIPRRPETLIVTEIQNLLEENP